jgi:hypothetical protein
MLIPTVAAHCGHLTAEAVRERLTHPSFREAVSRPTSRIGNAIWLSGAFPKRVYRG